MKHILFLSAIISLLFLACTTDTAGVITETESGKTIAGVVTDLQGKPLAHVQVALIDSQYIPARSLFKREVISDDSGKFIIDSIPQGSYRLSLNDSTEDRSLLTSVLLPSNDTLQINNLKLQKNGAFHVNLNLFKLNLGDTLCLTGSLYCKIIDSINDSTKYVEVNGITATSFTNLNILKANQTLEHFDIQWQIQSEKMLYITEQGNYFGKVITKTFNDSLSTGDYIADSIPMRFVLPNTFHQPMLLDAYGNSILLEKTEIQTDSSIYWGIVPNVNFSQSTSLSFYLLDSAINTTINTSPIRGLYFFDEEITNSTNITLPVFQDSAVGLSFRFKIDGKAQDTLGVTLISARTAEGKGFDIRQRDSDDSISICVRLYSDTIDGTIASSDTIIYGTAKLLDNEWQHYTLAINKAHITICANGEIIRNTDIKVTESFYNPSELIIGTDPMYKGSINELLLFDGKQDTSWIKTLYELQYR